MGFFKKLLGLNKKTEKKEPVAVGSKHSSDQIQKIIPTEPEKLEHEEELKLEINFTEDEKEQAPVKELEPIVINAQNMNLLSTNTEKQVQDKEKPVVRAFFKKINYKIITFIEKQTVVQKEIEKILEKIEEEAKEKKLTYLEFSSNSDLSRFLKTSKITIANCRQQFYSKPNPSLWFIKRDLIKSFTHIIKRELNKLGFTVIISEPDLKKYRITNDTFPLPTLKIYW